MEKNNTPQKKKISEGNKLDIEPCMKPILEHSNMSRLSDREQWNMFGHSLPKQEVVYFSQIIVLYIVIIIALINITLQNEQSNLWLSLLSGSIGYLLPNPSLKKETIFVQRMS